MQREGNKGNLFLFFLIGKQNQIILKQEGTATSFRKYTGSRLNMSQKDSKKEKQRKTHQPLTAYQQPNQVKRSNKELHLFTLYILDHAHRLL